MIRIRQANILNIFICPITLKRRQVIWPNCNNLRSMCCELGIIIAHARQLRAAIRSHKATQESKHNRLVSAITGKLNRFSVYVFKFKIRGKFAGGNETWVHVTSPMSSFAFFQIASNIFTVNFPVNVFCWLG